MSLVIRSPGADFQMQQPVDSPDRPISPLRVFSVLWRRKYSIMATAIILSGAALGVVSMLKPSFVATASVLMEERKPSLTDIPSASGVIATDSVAVRTQVDILKSTGLALGVIRSLHLVDRPEFGPHEGLLSRLLDLARPYDSHGLLDWAGLSSTARPLTLAERETLASNIVMGMTSIINDGRSYVIDIRVKVAASDKTHTDEAKALSAQLADAFADAYVGFTRKMKADSLRQSNSFFDERLIALQDKVRAAQHAVQDYRTANGLVEDRAASGEGRSVTVASQQMAQINTALIAATSDRAQKEATLDQIGAARGGRGDLSSVPEVVGSALIQRLRELQAELGAREANLAMSRGSASPELVAVRASQADISGKIAAETAKIAASLRSGVEAARAREANLRDQLALLQTQVAGQGTTEVKLIELQNEADTARFIYTSYLKRAQETANEIDMQVPDALVVSHADIPLGPVAPTTNQLGAAGVIVSFFLAGLVGLVRERLQGGFRTSDQFESSVGIGALGLVPKVRSLSKALSFKATRSAYAESIASIRAVLRLNMRGGASQVIMVTSAVPREGKTFFSSSLARSAALAGERVLLMDCDLRRPAITRTIGAPDSRDVEFPPDAAMPVTIHRDTLTPLDFTTLTGTHRSPQDLFASPYMRELIETLRQRYDLIVLDTPPVLAVSDARVLSALADVTVMVVCWQKTPQHLVSSAVNTLRNSGARVAGAVITQVKIGSLTASEGAYNYAYTTRN